MTSGAHVHDNRDRAESFGAVAADYDRYRPSYPDDLIDDLVDTVAPHPATVLDLGCGTGKAAMLLAARGLAVLGVEPDPAMAGVARTHGLDVEVGHFETWPDGGRRFDLITCAQAWHWIDPTIGAPKAARLLSRGGTLAVFWNFDDVDERAQTAINEVYAAHAPELSGVAAYGASRRDDRPYLADLQDSGAFASFAVHTYPWTRALPVDDWVNRVATQSQHLLLGPQRLSRLLAALRTALREVGPQVHSAGGTYTIRARVAD